MSNRNSTRLALILSCAAGLAVAPVALGQAADERDGLTTRPALPGQQDRPAGLGQQDQQRAQEIVNRTLAFYRGLDQYKDEGKVKMTRGEGEGEAVWEQRVEHRFMRPGNYMARTVVEKMDGREHDDGKRERVFSIRDGEASTLMRRGEALVVALPDRDAEVELAYILATGPHDKLSLLNPDAIEGEMPRWALANILRQATFTTVEEAEIDGKEVYHLRGTLRQQAGQMRPGGMGQQPGGAGQDGPAGQAQGGPEVQNIEFWIGRGDEPFIHRAKANIRTDEGARVIMANWNPEREPDLSEDDFELPEARDLRED